MPGFVWHLLPPCSHLTPCYQTTKPGGQPVIADALMQEAACMCNLAQRKRTTLKGAVVSFICAWSFKPSLLVQLENGVTRAPALTHSHRHRCCAEIWSCLYIQSANQLLARPRCGTRWLPRNFFRPSVSRLSVDATLRPSLQSSRDTQVVCKVCVKRTAGGPDH